MSSPTSRLPGQQIMISQLPSADISGGTAQSSSSKQPKTVRVFASQLPKDEDSSEDDAPADGHGESSKREEDSGNPPARHSSYSGSSTSPSARLSVAPSSASLHPKLARSATTGSSSTSAARAAKQNAAATSSASIAPPPSADLGPSRFQEWRTKYRSGSGTANHSTVLSGKVKTVRAENNTASRSRGLVDMVDPDLNYFSAVQRSHRLDDWNSDDDDEVFNTAVPGSSGATGAVHDADRHNASPSSGVPKSLPAPDSAEGRERLEWQSMLASVLSGDILQGESSRIGMDRPGDEVFRKRLGHSLWWEIRARMRGRSGDEEKRRVEERRARVVDSVLEEVEGFVVKKSGRGLERALSAEQYGADHVADNEAESSALDQVSYILEKLRLVEGLYPHQAALRAAKQLYDSEAFQARVDALTAWFTVVTALQAQLLTLQKWTGSDDLDVTKPNTTKEKALVGKNRYHPLDAKAKVLAQAANDQAADDSTFLERVMKEDNISRTFEKRVFVEVLSLILNARETVISHLPKFEELQLPDFQYELVRLIGFPGRLIIEALKVRLDAAAKLVDPNPMVINDMIENFRLGISLAVLIKRQYEDIVAPDADRRWVIPHCLPSDYDAVLLGGLRTFFRLLHWKLKSGSKAIYFRETDVLEDEWEFLYEAAEAIEGGDLVVAEHFCSLTNKLMVRVCNYFDSQLHVPVPLDRASVVRTRTSKKSQDGPDTQIIDQRPMDTEEMLVWFGKILDAVKMRYRKLQRFARRLTQRFDNSAEYALQDDDLDDFIQQLQESGHFLVYTQVFEEKGTYIVADGSLWDNPNLVRQMLQRAFTVLVPPRASQHPPESGQAEGTGAGIDAVNIRGEDADEDEDVAGYILLLSPRQNFAWTGAVMTLDLDFVEFDLEDNRVRLIADGPTSRLTLCKRIFADALLSFERAEPVVILDCVVEQQAHLPRIQRELRKIARSAYRLSESFIESAAHVRKTLHGAPGSQDMIENWYLFASDHGRRVGGHIDYASVARFSRLLMRLAISWVSFICDSCDPTDRKTFRWTVQALEYALKVTQERNILHLEPSEFSLLRKSVASLVSLLISHFDILGARSSMEAKKEAERLAAMRRLQRLQENIDDDFIPRGPSPSGQARVPIDRSIRLVREERLRLIAELEQRRVGLSNDQHLIGQVLDEQVSEDRALVFLAASTSNIALRWQQGAFIGGGANGNVYIGFNLDSGGVMAVKEIRVQEINNSPALYKQIKDESDVMSMLQHPNIVEYYGIEVHRDRVYIFEEYCEGGSLANLLEHGRVEDEEIVMVYALQILQGLEYLHSKGVEHRDIKPDNILLATNSVLKLVDFGAAKVIVMGNKTMARTRAARQRPTAVDAPAVMNSLAGTPMYMAPESIRNEKPGRLGASDIWSMGCVILEIATGRKPWSNLDNEWAIMFHIGISTQHPPLPEPGQLSDLGIDFIESCLTLNPVHRPTAAELLHHPWLIPMVQQVLDHAADAASPGGPSATSTLVDHEQTTYAARVAELARQDQMPSNDLSSSDSTPAGTTPSAAPDPPASF